MGQIVILLFISCFFSACAYNAAVSSAQVVYNRHNLEKNIDDNFTSMHVYHDITRYGNRYKNANIVIATYNDSVLLAGQAPTAVEKDEITRIVQRNAGKREIYNYMEVSNPTSSLTRASDSWITAKIKSQLMAINDIDPTQIKIVTENGTVYLMGIVPPEQAEIAVDVARATSGVQNVVKIFSYIRISKS
jgi:osmotically-inducible protein OsmY